MNPLLFPAGYVITTPEIKNMKNKIKIGITHNNDQDVNLKSLYTTLPGNDNKENTNVEKLDRNSCISITLSDGCSSLLDQGETSSSMDRKISHKKDVPAELAFKPDAKPNSKRENCFSSTPLTINSQLQQNNCELVTSAKLNTFEIDNVCDFDTEINQQNLSSAMGNSKCDALLNSTSQSTIFKSCSSEPNHQKYDCQSSTNIEQFPLSSKQATYFDSCSINENDDISKSSKIKSRYGRIRAAFKESVKNESEDCLLSNNIDRLISSDEAASSIKKCNIGYNKSGSDTSDDQFEHPLSCMNIKIGCQCVNCKMWTESKFCEKGFEFENGAKTTKKEIIMAPPLLKELNDDVNMEVQAVNYNKFSSKLARDTLPALLVHG